MYSFISKIIATGFFTGYLPLFPGTWASLFTMLILYFCNFSGYNLYLNISLIVIMFFIGVITSTTAEKNFNEKDPKKIVIDEICGYLIAMLFIPYSLINFFAGFILFRFFDIVKPFPARQIQSLPGGWGIMIDDVIAGIYSNISLQVLLLLLIKQ